MFRRGKKTKRRGFSIIELVVVVGIVLIIAAIAAAPNFLNARNKKSLELTVQRIKTEVRAVSERARAQENENQWWIHFANPTGSGNDFYSVCSGIYSGVSGANCTAEGGVESSRGFIGNYVSFADPTDNASKDLVFAKGTGLPVETTDLVISGAGLSARKLITVHTNGRIDEADLDSSTPLAPTVATVSASDITAATATLNGSVNPNNLTTNAWFRYVATTSPGTCDDSFGTLTATQPLGAGNAGVAYSQGITGLTIGETYYFCAIANNSMGTNFGDVLSFVATSAPSGGSGPQTLPCTDANVFVTNGDYIEFDNGGISPGTQYDITGPDGTFFSIVKSDGTGNTGGSANRFYLTGVTSPSGPNISSWTRSGAIPVGTPLDGTWTIATSPTSTYASFGPDSNPAGTHPVKLFVGGKSIRFGVYAAAPANRPQIFNWHIASAGSTYNDYGSDATIPTAGTDPTTEPEEDPNNGVYFTCTPSAPPPAGSPPTVETDPASAVSGASATLNGSANPNGSATTGWFRYSSTFMPVCSDSAGTRVPASGGPFLGSGSSSVPYSQFVSLSSNTTYYFCALASNSSGTGTGEVLSFTTYGAPTVTTSPASSIATTTATLNGSANPNGLSTTGWFRYSTTNPATCNNTFGTLTSSAVLGAGTSDTPYSKNISGLAPSTAYYFCAIAANSVGNGYGAVLAFTTLPSGSSAPTVVTTPATAISTTTATLNGQAAPNGGTTHGWFRYSTTNPVTCNNTFGTRAPVSSVSDPNLLSGTVPVAYSWNISGLSVSTIYYFCALAENGFGVSTGVVLSFTTIPSGSSAPTVVTSAADISPGSTAVVLNGQANPNGNLTTGWFRYGTINPVTCSNTFSGGTSTAASALGSGTALVPYSQNISGLADLTTYYYCAIALNSVGTGYGEVVAFTTGCTYCYSSSNSVTTPATSISAQFYHSCAVIYDGTVKCWGTNSDAELGTGSSTPATINYPIAVSGITNATQVSDGGAHTCALLSDGTVKCWGYNGEGELGNGTNIASTAPVLVSGMSSVIQISSGNSHSCALLSGGTVKCWGWNGYGQLGNGTTTNSNTPVTVALTGTSIATQVSADTYHTCALMADGTIECWGWNTYGQLGDGTYTDSSTPVLVLGIATYIDPAAPPGNPKTVACSSTKVVIDPANPPTNTPPAPQCPLPAIQVSAGQYHTCAVISGGSIKCWGHNNDGQLGNGGTWDTGYPYFVMGIGPASDTPCSTTSSPPCPPAATEVSSGTNHTCAVISDNTLKCWGSNTYGELGDGTYTDSLTPIAVSGISDATAVSVGYVYSCALTANSNPSSDPTLPADSTVHCWGYNSWGQLGNNTYSNTNVPVPVTGL